MAGQIYWTGQVLSHKLHVSTCAEILPKSGTINAKWKFNLQHQLLFLGNSVLEIVDANKSACTEVSKHKLITERL